MILKWVDELFEDWKEMVKRCDVELLMLIYLRYCFLWEIMFGKFRCGIVIVVGDVMYVMGLFFG